VTCGLEFRKNTRIDLAEFAAQHVPMGDVAILFQPARKPVSAAEVWLARAERIRSIAMVLAVKDAQVLKAYAAECEAEAERMIRQPRLKIAA
jgi:hypothetical protein